MQQPDPFHFERCITDDERDAAIDLVTDDDNRAILKYALDVLCLDKRQLVALINADGDFAALGKKTAEVNEYAEMLHALANMVEHAAATIHLVMSDPHGAVLIGSGGGNAH